MKLSLRAGMALVLIVLLAAPAAGAASPYLYRPLGTHALQWPCGPRDVHLRGVPEAWVPLVTDVVAELSTALPGQAWRVVTGPVPAGAEVVLEYRSMADAARGQNQHTIDDRNFRTAVVTINRDLVRSPLAAATRVTLLHELAHAAGLDHRDDDPYSITSRRPARGIGPWTGHLSAGDRAALMAEGCSAP